MWRLLVVIVCITSALLGQTQTADRPPLSEILRFEAPHNGDQPGGWVSKPSETVCLDDEIVHGGRVSARLERSLGSDGDFSMIGYSIPMDFTGKTIEFRGFLKTKDVTGFAALVLREDHNSSTVAIATMQSKQPVIGTTDWTEYSVQLSIDPSANILGFFVVLHGDGTAWADNLQVLVDGRPLPDRGKLDREADHEFDDGSHVVLTGLTDLQIQNLTTLGKVWGFLKYYHPQVTAGRYQWDYELFRIMPSILRAPDHAAASDALLSWINGLGNVSNCGPCALLDSRDIHLRPALDWIFDQALLGPVSPRLLSILDNRTPAGKQFYASAPPDFTNVSFARELDYQSVALPDPGFQLLALYRFWNIVQYWSPYRDVIKEDWDRTLAEFIPRIALAKDTLTYRRELAALIAKVHDTNANLWNALESLPPSGECQVPVNVRFLDGQAVVSGYSAESALAADLRPGDIIVAIDGMPLRQLRNNLAPFYAASNEVVQLRDIGRNLTRGACSIQARLRLQRNGEELDVTEVRLPIRSLDLSGAAAHDARGPAFRLLSDKVAYLNLSGFKNSDARGYIEQAANTMGLVIDIRNYPSETAVFALGQLLTDKPRDFARFTTADLSNPGAFHWSRPVELNPNTPRYTGRVVIIVDEITQGEAEYSAMALSAAPGAVIVGSTTAGAASHMLPVTLPGGLHSSISGVGVFYPDKRPTQRVGIVPDLVVEPTVAGIRAGRDEVLELALREILGSDVPAAEIERMIHHLF